MPKCLQVIDGRVYLDGVRRPDLDLPADLEAARELALDEIQRRLDAIYAGVPGRQTEGEGSDGPPADDVHAGPDRIASSPAGETP